MGETHDTDSLDLLLDLLPGQLGRFVDQQSDDLGIVDVGVPQLFGQPVITTDLLGESAKLGQSDATAF